MALDHLGEPSLLEAATPVSWDPATLLSVLATVMALVGLSFSFWQGKADWQAAKEAAQANEIARDLLSRDRNRETEALAARNAARVRVLREFRRDTNGDWFVLVLNAGPAPAWDVSIQVGDSGNDRTKIFAGSKSGARRAELLAGETWVIPTMRTETGVDVLPVHGAIGWEDGSETRSVSDFTIRARAEEAPFVTS